MKMSMELIYQYMAIFFNFSPTPSHLHPLQVENCDSNLRLVVYEDDNGKSRPERVNTIIKFPKILVEQNFLFEIFRMAAILSRENRKNGRMSVLFKSRLLP